MGQFATYELWLCDWTGAQIAYLSGTDLVSFTWQLRLNEPGTYRYEVVAETGKQDLFKIDYILKLRRDYGAGLYEEFVGFHLNSEEWLTQNDEHYWASYGLGPEWMLDQPLLQPLPTPNPDFPRYETWWMHGPADDVMKKMVSESMGSAAILSRQFAYLAIEGNKSAGAVSCYDGRYVRLLGALQSISAERGETDFKVVCLPTGGFEFRTYCPRYGTDRRKGYAAVPTVFSLELQNVGEPKRTSKRSTEVTVAIGGWEGSEQDQELFERLNTTALAESPYRHREQYYDMSNVVQSDVINGMLDQYLIDDGKLEEVQFTPLQTNACLYGRDWNLGDLVTLELWGYEYDMRITEVNGRISGDNEEEIVAVAELMWDGNVISLPPSYTPPPELVALGVGDDAVGSVAMFRSASDGVSWVLVEDFADASDSASNIVEVGTDSYAVATGQAGGTHRWWLSTDNGFAWGAVDTAAGSRFDGKEMIRAANGYIVAAADLDMYRSTDCGASYTLRQSLEAADVDYWVNCLALTTTGRIYAGIYRQDGSDPDIWYSDDNGGSWVHLCTLVIGVGTLADIEVSDGGNIGVIANSDYGYSSDTGATWNWEGVLDCIILYKLSNGTILRSRTGGVIESSVNGIAWGAYLNIPVDVYNIAESPSGAITFSDGGQHIYRYYDGVLTHVWDGGATDLMAHNVFQRGIMCTPVLWWMAAGIVPWQAQSAEGAADLASSYIDLTGNANHLSAVAVPDWDAVNGWKFDGTMALDTGFIPQNNQTQTVIIKYSTYPGGAAPAGLFGLSYGGLSNRFAIELSLNYWNGGFVNRPMAPASAIIGVAGNQGYLNGVADGGAIGAWGATVPAHTCYIGAVRVIGGLPWTMGQMYVQKHVIFDVALTAPQIAAMVAAM